MKIKFTRMLTQRYRAILHLIDPLTNQGHDLFLCLGHRPYSPQSFYKNPWNVNAVDHNAMEYLANNFGIKVQNLSKVHWTSNKYEPCDLVLNIDVRGVRKRKVPKGQLNIPYNGFACYTPKGKVAVGNPLCQAIRERQLIVSEEEGTVVIIHPGGGRDFISPKRKQWKRKGVIESNIALMNKTLAQMPPQVKRVIIKTHPAPYLGCDKSSIENDVIPHLSSKKVEVQEGDLIGTICRSEFIINYGSSTSIWLLGSKKKWLNIIDQARFNLKAENRRDKIARAENWSEWPQNVPLDKVKKMMNNYTVNYDLPFIQKYQHLFNEDAIANILRLI